MIYKSNALIEAAYRLTVQEQRILLACIAQVRRDQPITDEVLYSVSAEDLARLSGAIVEGTYTELKEAALRLKRREVRLIEEPNGKGRKPKVMITGWVQTIIYVEGEGRVELRFTKDMLPYLSQLTEQFTRYALSDVSRMTNTHAIRLFELLAQYEGVGEREISIEQLREWLQLEDSYPVWADLKRWAIEPAIQQINDHSPLTVAWEQRKTGRKVTHLVFTFERKDKAKKLSEAEMAAQARPGESWDQLKARLKCAHP